MKHFIYCLTLISFATYADIFTIAPNNQQASTNPSGLLTALKVMRLKPEPIIVDGHSLTMGIGLSTEQLNHSRREISILYPNAKVIANSNSLLIENIGNNNEKYRIFLIEVGGKYPVIQFSMKIPKTLDKLNNWTDELPLPNLCEPITYMHFTKKNTFYGHFRCYSPPDIALRDFTASIAGNGWYPVTPDSVSQNRKGELFLNNKTKKMMMISFSKQKGSIYIKPLK